MKKAKIIQSIIKSNMFTPYEDCLIASWVLLSNSFFVVFVWAENHSQEQIRTSPTNGLSMVNFLFVVFVWAKNHSREHIRTNPANGLSMVNSLFVVFVWAENHSQEQIRTSPTNERSMVNKCRQNIGI